MNSSSMVGGILALGAALAVVGAGLTAAPLVFAELAPVGLSVGALNVGGLKDEDLTGALQIYATDLQGKLVEVQLKEQSMKRSLAELGFGLDIAKTRAAIEAQQGRAGINFRRTVQPELTFDSAKARQVLHEDFKSVLSLPQNSTLQPAGNNFVLVSGHSGEQIDTLTLEQDVRRWLGGPGAPIIDLVAITAPAPIQDNEVTAAKQLAELLVKDGFMLDWQEQKFTIQPFTLKRLIKFVEQADPLDERNTILGVAFDLPLLQEYLQTTLVPEINQEAVNARFAVAGSEVEGVERPRVEQFALPQEGRLLNVDQTTDNITQTLATGQRQAALAVEIVAADASQTADTAALGIDKLLARGESDFAGSPRNRIHNITVGAARYHGLLIAPGEEFSFNKFLGPVDAASGFKPELVIKTNVTVPEFGGGLCQVSTTVFRAAIKSGMAITNRRNHSYAVSYYGTPGFDATIYPPYTDFRFLNNTPGYILIQTKVEGTKLIFEFWGTDDGRLVEVIGPSPYNRQSDGAVKATLTQKVTKDGQTLIEETFYSNYKSPKLFPKVLSANSASQPTATPSPVPPANNESSSTPKPAAAPTTPSTANPKPTSKAASIPKPTPTPAAEE